MVVINIGIYILKTVIINNRVEI